MKENKTLEIRFFLKPCGGGGGGGCQVGGPPSRGICRGPCLTLPGSQAPVCAQQIDRHGNYLVVRCVRVENTGTIPGTGTTRTAPNVPHTLYME